MWAPYALALGFLLGALLLQSQLLALLAVAGMLVLALVEAINNPDYDLEDDE